MIVGGLLVTCWLGVEAGWARWLHVAMLLAVCPGPMGVL